MRRPAKALFAEAAGAVGLALAYFARACSKGTNGISITSRSNAQSEISCALPEGGDRDFPTLADADSRLSGLLLLELIPTEGDGTDCVTLILALLFESISYKE